MADDLLCPICVHGWARHDPEDGRCDAHAYEGIGVCPCGRNLDWMVKQMAVRSRNALLRAASERSQP